MNKLALIADINEFIDSLNYSFQEFVLRDFIEHIAFKRRKEIILTPVRFSPSTYGVWIPAESADYIFYRENTHIIHQEHIILHEIGHMLLGHQAQLLNELLVDDVDISTLIGNEALFRKLEDNPYDDVQEQEAELFSQIIQQRFLHAKRVARLTTKSTSIEQVRSLADGLGFHD